MPRRRFRPGCLIALLLLALAAVAGWREYQRQVREHPERFPWTALDLDDPVGPFTAAKLGALADDAAQCRALLQRAGDRDRAAPPLIAANPECGYADGMRLVPDGPRAIAYRPGDLVTACPVAAALRLWEGAVQQAADRHLGTRVTRIDTFGSYNCRRLYGRSDGQWSEHATADAVDIAAFRLADGRTVSVLGDWTGGTPAERAFLRSARDEACRLFATTLSPDYNAAHRDHLHLDQARRGAGGWTLCR